MRDVEACDCPFCGNARNKLVEVEPSHWIVECEGCGAIGPRGAQLDSAVAAWNRRVVSKLRDSAHA